MDEKKNVLEAWIMVEQLSEGDINLREKDLKEIELPEGDDYYSLFSKEIEKKKMKDYQKGGIVLYFNIFKFENVIDLLRKKYGLSKTEEEIEVGNKFSFAVYFDKGLRLVGDLTFFTESNYILSTSSVPEEKEFSEYEEKNREYIKKLFECPEEEEYKKFFNEAFAKLISKYSIDISNSRMKVLANLETDSTNLHSFFVADLKKAKSISTDNLNRYLVGKVGERINLDSRKDSSRFDPIIFQKILQPQNYPVSRFPSNPKYALYFMQQVAVNLAIGYDNEHMRSVNGPPGTGKTTLLKDIFSELIVEQAYEILQLKSKEIKEKALYFENASIGILPQSIVEKEIVVASSNNGAVQNIVKELPLISGIDAEFIGELKTADYFWDISNSSLSTDWKTDENGKKVEVLIAEKQRDEKNWGLFSLEGGKKDNMGSIITTLKHIVSNLENDYFPDDKTYDDFNTLYNRVCNYKEERQKIYEECLSLIELKGKHKKEVDSYEKIKEKLSTEYSQLKEDLLLYEKQSTNIRTGIEEEIRVNQEKLDANSFAQKQIAQAIEALKLQRPKFFSPRNVKKSYKERKKSLSEKAVSLYQEAIEISNHIHSSKDEVASIAKILREKSEKVAEKEKRNAEVFSVAANRIEVLAKQIKVLTSKLDGLSLEKLDMGIDYDKLQLGNPWFDVEYRKLQSRLFIAALKLRKQFLYENRKSVKAACIIWNQQKNYSDNNKQVIALAWNWINLAIPVIGSTFASINTMCKNLGEETIGHLFVDEAGQALPQASVGAIFRSKNVMVVGDPSQIKPVLTLDSSILSMLGKHYKVSGKYLSDEASTQTLVDNISKYGFYKSGDSWIGIPLWVHRRCKNPMFDIANAISYEGNMVQSSDIPGKAFWYDISGSANDKYVKEQGEFLREKLSELIKHNPRIIDKSQKDTVYVISPFKNVAYQLSQELKKIGFTRYGDDGKPKNIGTVHTFQGKEAPIVFLVLGCDGRSLGAANWAMGSSNPNIMNVASTRAKDEFYIIGDKSLFLRTKSEVINEACRIIDKFNSGTIII